MSPQGYNGRMIKKAITPQGITPVGPYSVAVDAGSCVYLSGQLGIDPATKALAEGVSAQARHALNAVETILAEAGLGFQNVVKTTVFLADMKDFAEMNGEYAKRFSQPFPARSTVAVAGLPMGARFEIELIAQR